MIQYGQAENMIFFNGDKDLEMFLHALQKQNNQINHAIGRSSKCRISTLELGITLMYAY
jgi:hypothetical protein